jgi:cysteine-rich repeat protein
MPSSLQRSLLSLSLLTLVGCNHGPLPERGSSEAGSEADSGAESDANTSGEEESGGDTSGSAGESGSGGENTSGENTSGEEAEGDSSSEGTSGECGDGVIDSDEECDDGNTDDDDGCSSECVLESCGDGIVQMDEACDDGNIDDNDGCSSGCVLEICGDGVIQADELCDDGNDENNDGCNSSCTSDETCGNGVLDPGESCDDGNNVDGDGCDALCGVQLGVVDLVPYYEVGSAWESNPTAQNMVDTLFAQVEATLRTSGYWDATIEVYLTDDNSNFANTTFTGGWKEVQVDGQTLRVQHPWAKIVQGAADPNGPIQPDGSNHDFAIHFNVLAQGTNAGLLRHELMHGLGCVNSIPFPTMSFSDVLGGLDPGTRHQAALYDLSLADSSGIPLLADYLSTDSSFEVQPYSIELTHASWSDGSSGLTLVGVADDGSPYPMPLMTQSNADGSHTNLSEPSTVMSSADHPTWDTVEEPDRAFLRAMRYHVVDP